MRKVHFIGVLGVSMGWLANYMRENGWQVTGSDLNLSGHNIRNIPKGCDLVITNSAITDDNIELRYALATGIKVMAREELLNQIMQSYNHRIAVAGSHGKSTTVAMISHIFKHANIPIVTHNGARMLDSDLGDSVTSGEIFLTEACEYKKGLLKLKPTVAVITNMDTDHMECYRDFDDVKTTFEQFACSAKTVIRGELGEPGKYNESNAHLATRVAKHFGIDDKTIAGALATFPGIVGRAQYLGKVNNCAIIADYAHHPTELRAIIDATKAKYKRILIIFQPHTYTRTIKLYDDFVRVLSTVDCVLYKTFIARGKPIKGGGAIDLARSLGKKYIATIPVLKRFIEHTTPNYDAVILAGAGDMANKLHPLA